MEYIWTIALPLAVSFLISTVLLKLFIPVLRKVKLGQKILEIGPSWHKCKEGTPVLGGLFFLLSTVIAFAGWLLFSGNTPDPILGSIAILALLSALTGFIDDYIKLFKKRNKGLTGKQKLVLQFLIAGAFLAYRALVCEYDTSVRMFGLFGQESVDLGWFYYLLMLFVIVYVINCANLTDGIDGLAGSVALIQCVFFLCVGVFFADVFFAAEEMNVLCAALAGGLLGFLVFNFHPAKIFMGDTGSLFLGGFVTAVVFAYGAELLLLPICFIWFCEGISDVLQVFYFRVSGGKRLFKMAPLHHHFELCKWSEVRVVFVFSFVSALTGALAYWLMTR